MLREDHICDYCDAEYTVESEVEDIVSFCPYCGSEITYDEPEDDIWDEDEEE